MKELLENQSLKYETLCPLCNKTIKFKLDDNELKKNMIGDLAVLTLEPHGSPKHILTVYINKEGIIKGSYPFLVDKTLGIGKRGLKYNHIVDATSDLTIEEGRNFGIEVIPYEIIINDDLSKNYPNEITPPEIMNMIVQNRKIEAKAISTEKFLETFKRIDNDRPILLNTISSQMNKTHKNAVKAKKVLAKENKALAERIHITDSNASGSILRTMAKNATEIDRKGKDLNEVLKYTDWLSHYHRTYFIVDDAEKIKGSNFLGRYSGFFGGVRGIKPLITCNADGMGKVEPCKNVRTFKDGMTEIGRLIKLDFLKRGFEGTIFHAMSEDNAYKLLEYLDIMFKVDKDNFTIEACCSTLIVNSGPGILGLSIYPKIKV